MTVALFGFFVVNAGDVKHLPGRPKTDRLDAVWLCKVAERQMLQPSFVPPPPSGSCGPDQVPGRPGYRPRTAEKQRNENLLEDAQMKLSVVASDIFGVAGRQMMAALIAGERDPRTLAEMARGSMRAKNARLVEAFMRNHVRELQALGAAHGRDEDVWPASTSFLRDSWPGSQHWGARVEVARRNRADERSSP